MNKKIEKYLTLFIILIFIFTLSSCKKNKDTKYVDIYNTVKEIFLTNNGYNDEMYKHVSKTVFERTNIYCVYSVNNPKYKKPLKIDFSLAEKSQEKKMR